MLEKNVSLGENVFTNRPQNGDNLDDDRLGTNNSTPSTPTTTAQELTQLDTNRSDTYFKTGTKRHRSYTTRDAK